MYFSFLLFHRLFRLEYVFAYSNSLLQISKRKYLLELFKRTSEAYPKNMLQESTLYFDQ